MSHPSLPVRLVLQQGSGQKNGILSRTLLLRSLAPHHGTARCRFSSFR